MGISEKIAYLKGLMEGMNVDTESNEGKLFATVVDVLDEIALEVEDLTDEVMELGDGLDVISDDLSDVEDIVYDEWDDDDEDDEDAPSVPGFAVKSIAMGVLWAAIVMLVCAAANGVVSGATEGLGAIVFQLLRGFEASVAAVVVTFVLAPIYLLVLRRRDEQGADTSGLALQVVALVLAVVVFVGVALALVTPVLG